MMHSRLLAASLALLVCITGLTAVFAAQPARRDYKVNHYYVIEHVDESIASPEDVAKLLNVKWEGPIGELRNHHLYSAPRRLILTRRAMADANDAQEEDDRDLVLREFGRLKEQRSRTKSRLERRSTHVIDGLVSVEKQTLRKRHKRMPVAAPPPIPAPVDSTASTDAYLPYAALGINDPGFLQQWHLFNPVNGHDINVTGVWQAGITGKGVIVSLIDDGLDSTSEDLAANYFAEGSWDFNDHQPVPMPKLSDDLHGTRCAGEIAAVRNDVCGVGVAFDSKVSGIRMLSGVISDADEAEALNFKYQKNDIYSCSWGPADDGRSVDGPKGLVLKALVNGIQNGRDGKGSIFVFASGNGGGADDNCNYDGYTNSIYTITVGAIDSTGSHPYYSEQCSALLITTYSSGSGMSIFTTDVGKETCTNRHGGTSAAAPIAAGVFALALSIRPDLTWRDAQYLALTSAVPININDSTWSRNAAGRLFSHKFGYGKIDAYNIVQNAKTFKNLGPQVVLETPFVNVDQEIPPTPEGLRSRVVVTKNAVKKADFGRLEHVAVTVNLEHQQRGDLAFNLFSPHGIKSELAAPRRYDMHSDGLFNWTFMSVKHWDEDPVGEWTFQVLDQVNPDRVGILLNWTITFWGEQADHSESKPKQAAGGQKPKQAAGGQKPKQAPAGSETEHKPKEEPPEESPPESTDKPAEDVSTVPQYPPWVDDDSDGSGRKSTTKWIFGGIGVITAFLFAGLAVRLIRRRYDRGGGDSSLSAGKLFGNNAYEFSALRPSEMSASDGNVDSSVPLRAGMTSREVLDAFGDIDDDDEDEGDQVLFENHYTDQYRDDVGENASEVTLGDGANEPSAGEEANDVNEAGESDNENQR